MNSLEILALYIGSFLAAGLVFLALVWVYEKRF